MKCLRALCLLVCCLASSLAQAVLCSDIFTNGVQAHAATGNVALSNGFSVTGGTGVLKTFSLSNTTGASCGGGTCTASGTPATTSSPTFLTWTGGGSVNVPVSGATVQIGAGDYASITFKNSSKLIFKTLNSVYRITTIDPSNSDVTLQMPAGDYWINGNLTLGSRAIISRLASTGPTRIFVNGDVTLGFQTKTVGFNSNELLIYATGRIIGRNELNMSAYMYAAGNLELDYLSVINGAVAGANVTANNQNITVNYQGSNLSSVDFSPFCSNVVPAGPDHIYLELNGSTPITCRPTTVTVKACANSDCSLTYNDPVTVTLSASSGTWASSSLTFTGSTTTSFSKTTVGNTTLDASSSPSALGATTCQLNGVYGCNISFVDSALLLTIPTQTGGVTSSGANRMTLSAVRASDNYLLACVPAFANVTRTIDFWSTYTFPSTGTQSVAVAGAVANVSTTTLAASTASTGTPVSVTFDANGSATLPLQYPDAGRVVLKARYDGSVASNDAGLLMTGEKQFTTVPYGICVDSPDSGWGCTAADLSCAKYKTAGEVFNLRVSAKTYQASTALCAMPNAANFKLNSIPLSSTVVAPAGGSNGALGTSNISITTGGTATVSQTQSEVGVFKFTATPPAYAGETLSAATSDNFGRFVPAGFAIASPTVTPRSAQACSPVSNFSYMGEATGLGFTFNAVNSSGAVTSNYRGTFARLALAPSADLYFGAQQGSTLLNSRLSTVCTGSGGVCGSWGNGTANLSAAVTLSRAAGSTVDGPFETLKLGLKATDADGVGFLSPNYNWDLATAPLVNEGVQIGGTSALRFGRVRIGNAYGSAVLPLPIPSVLQYWNGSSFVKNSDDNCTSLPAPTIVSRASTTIANVNCNGGGAVDSGLTGVTASVRSYALAGEVGLQLTKPTSSAGGSLNLALAVPDYLKYNWDGIDQTLPACTASADGNLNDDNPRALIRYGAKSNRSIIYKREIY